MNEKYEKPILEFDMFDIEDVITTSCQDPDCFNPFCDGVHDGESED